MRRIIRNKTKLVSSIAMAVILLSGCGAQGSIEQEVAKALGAQAEEAQALAQAEEEIEPEAALEYVEIEEPDVALMTDSELGEVVSEVAISEADEQGNTETMVPQVEERGPLQIVFLGDSIFDSVRDETGIAYLVGQEFGADVYNLAIGGTSAGLRRDKETSYELWNEPNFLGVLHCMTGDINNGLLDKYKSGEVMQTLDPSKTDYFIVEYGTNDFLWYIPLGASDYEGQYMFYFRTALDMGLDLLQEKYPNAKIILCTPYYEEFWSADRTRYIGDIHSVNNGYGTLLDYISVAQDSAKDHNIPSLNMYDLMEINNYNVNDMTVDGIHPSEVARQKYADILINQIKEMEGTVSE